MIDKIDLDKTVISCFDGNSRKEMTLKQLYSLFVKMLQKDGHIQIEGE